MAEEEILSITANEEVDDARLRKVVKEEIEKQIRPLMNKLNQLTGGSGPRKKNNRKKNNRVTDRNDDYSIDWYNKMREITDMTKSPEERIALLNEYAPLIAPQTKKKPLSHKQVYTKRHKQVTKDIQKEEKQQQRIIKNDLERKRKEETMGSFVKAEKGYEPGQYPEELLPTESSVKRRSIGDTKLRGTDKERVEHSKRVNQPYLDTLFPSIRAREQQERELAVIAKKNKGVFAKTLNKRIDGELEKIISPQFLKTLGKGIMKIGTSSGGITKNPWGMAGFGLGQLSRLGAAGAVAGAAVASIIGSVHMAENVVKFLGEKGYPLNRDFYRLADDHAYGLWSVEEEKRRLLGHDAYIITQTDRYQPDSGSTTFNSLENRDDVILSKVGLAEKAVGIDYQGWT